MINITISDELHEHYEKVKQHRDNVVDDQNSEDRDKVAALNAVTAILKDLIKMQESAYNSEKIGRLQQEVINALRDVDHAFAERVLNAMERRLTMENEP
jgi:hypothetical protein